MSATLGVTVAGPTVAGSTLMRGTRFIECGFTQDITTPEFHGLFDFANNPAIGPHRRTFSLEGTGPHLDTAPATPTKPASTIPWHDSQATFGTQGFLAINDIHQPLNTTFNVTDSPSPRPSDWLYMDIPGVPREYMDSMHMRMEFNLYFAVRTTVTTNNAHIRFVQRYIAQWEADGSGTYLYAVPPIPGQNLGFNNNNSSGSSSLQVITNGALVPITTGTTYNTLSNAGSYTTIP